MKKDYTNANKRFYDKNSTTPKNGGRKEKKAKLRAYFYIYIFNNLNRFEKLVDNCYKFEKDLKNKILAKPSFSVHGIPTIYLFSMNPDDNVTIERDYFSCFIGMEKELKEFLNEFRKGTEAENFYLLKKVLCFFLNKKEYSKELFIKYLLEEFNKNDYLKIYSRNFDFDTILGIAVENKDILQIVHKDVKYEIIELLEFIEE